MIETKRLRAVFLDRDGVLNRAVVRDGKPFPPNSVTELEIIPGTREALVRLREAGYLLLVVTNQPDVAKGIQTREAVEAIHSKLMAELPLDGVFTCYHVDADRCTCRKPLPGLLQEAASLHGVELRESFMIGDRWRDVDAGYSAGCRTILLDYHYDERGPKNEPAVRVNSLEEAARWILALRPAAPL